MAEALFEVGNVEKHKIKVYESLWTAKVRIWIDDKEMVKTYQIGFNDKSYKFQVGNTEIHDVEIKVGGLITAKFEIFVDGKLISTA